MRILRGNSNRYQVRLLAVALLAVALLAVLGFVAAGPGAAAAQHSMSSVAVKTRKISGLGVVLTNTAGHTLYVFMKDAHHRVTCTKANQCQSFWPPLKWKSAGKPKAGGTAKSGLLGWDTNPGGGKVVTYNHWPLYTFLNDNAAGQAKGWNRNLNGGKWYVISAKGTVVKHKTSGGGGGGTTTGGGSWG